MHRPVPSILALLAVASAYACSSSGDNTVQTEMNTTTVGGTVNSANTSQSATITNSMTASSTVGTVTGTNTGSTMGGTGGATATTGMSSSSGGSGNCTDTPPDDRQTCATWAEWGECDAEWLANYCHQSCNRCPTASNTGANSTGAGGMSSNTMSTGNSMSTSDTTGSSMSTTGGMLGDDNPWGEVNGGQQGWASRYWDCCKPSCGWEGNASNPVISCDINDNKFSSLDDRNGCENNGVAYSCHSMAPWAYSTQVSFGFAAINGAPCGTCFHLQFTGSAGRGTPMGADQLAGKHMIVMATNIGGIEQGQFDILIPGGGVGLLNGCSTQWGVSNEELGAQYGGFRSVCQGEDLNQIKSCVANRCESVFGSRGLTHLYDGCMWYVDWFHAADNPDFRYEQVDCPAELVAAAH